MLKTLVRPSEDLFDNYEDVVKSVKEHDRIIITNNGVGEFVLINIEDYTDYEEFLHQRFIYNELQKSKAEAAGPNVKLIGADEVFGRIKQKIKDRGL
ncbi:MAG: type II toxin-antitoxin system prevent-host-death family antitoxin [Clostridiales bacterium]|nr:type II toxin-antitoxin system prevent-host-death family antitoxin [Clostridiales bacterium]